MKISIFLSFILALAATDTNIDSLASTCDRKACQLPVCRCSGTDIPGGLDPKDVPQFIILTFDDAVNVINMQTYHRMIYNRTNSNECPSGATFYINHEYTNYQAVNELYNKGFEIALHSITHHPRQSYWRNATYDVLVKEFANQRIQMAHFANIPSDSIKGIRIPFIQLSGDEGFKMMANHSLLYDATWPTTKMVDPGLWPYTLHYRSTQDCVLPPCPKTSIPGPWVFPLIPWSDLKNVPCLFIDACFWIPARTNEEDWYEFILRNFDRHYRGNRAPFGVFIREWYLSAYPAVQNALIRFLDLVNNLNDVFMVNTYEVLEWVRYPIPIRTYRVNHCNSFQATTCPYQSCGPFRAKHNNMDYYLKICNKCPRVYPWLDNHLGQ